MIRVLILVHQNVAELVLIDRQYIRVFFKKPDRIKKDIVEVHRIIGQKLIVISSIDLRDRGDTDIPARQPRILLRRLHIVLRLTDHTLDQARGEELIVQLHLLNALFNDLQLVIRIQDRIGLGIAEELRMAAEDTREHRVKSTDPHIPGSIADQAVDTLTHLVGRLICKGDGQNTGRIDTSRPDQVSDTERDHARLPRAGAGQNQERAFIVQYRLSLFIIQLFKQLVHLFLHVG